MQPALNYFADQCVVSFLPLWISQSKQKDPGVMGAVVFTHKQPPIRSLCNVTQVEMFTDRLPSSLSSWLSPRNF